jgi:hypothetical protein
MNGDFDPRDLDLRRWKNLWAFARDVLTFTAGLAGVIYETIFASSVNTTLLFAFMAMIGLPAFLTGGVGGPPKKDPDGRRDGK